MLGHGSGVQGLWDMVVRVLACALVAEIVPYPLTEQASCSFSCLERLDCTHNIA